MAERGGFEPLLTVFCPILLYFFLYKKVAVPLAITGIEPIFREFPKIN